MPELLPARAVIQAMEPAPALDPIAGRRFARRVLMPVIASTLVTLGAAGGGLWWAADRSDAISIDRQVRVAERAISASIEAVPAAQLPFAIWDDMAAAAQRPRSGQWFADSVGVQIDYAFPDSQTYLLDKADKPVNGYASERPLAPESFEALRPALAAMIAEARGRSLPVRHLHDRLFSTPRPPLTTHTSGRVAPVVYAAHLIRVLDRPAAVSVMRVEPTTFDVAQADDEEPLFVTVRFLNAPFLRELSQRNLIDQPRFSESALAASDEASMRLAGDDGRTVGYLLWRPERPGSRLLSTLAPLSVAAGLVIVGMMALLVERLRHAMRRVEASEADAKHAALHDVLTGLPNRALFGDRLDTVCARAARGEPAALLLLDLDRFKAVNDTLGHAAGDGVLREFTRRVRVLLRASDTIARFGGDEFGVILPNVRSREAVESLCKLILAAATRPFGLPEGVARVGVSIGVALLPEAGTARLETMRAADRALYWAKGEGRGHYRLFDADPTRGEVFARAAA